MFPTNSYNTPLGYQFGREAAAFTEEDRINPELWDDALTERAYEQTPDARVESIREAQEAAAAIAQTSRVEAQTFAQPIERQSSREQAVQDAHDLSRLGAGMRYMRDHKDDFGVAA